MDGLIVRESRLEDLEGILRLWVQMVEFHADRDPALRMRTDAEALESMRTYLRSGLENPDSRLFVADVADREGLAGFLFAHVRAVSPLAVPPTCGYVSDICVDDPLRQQGIGRELFLAAKDWFRERGQTVIRLHAATANPASQSFWRAMGAAELMVLMKIDL